MDYVNLGFTGTKVSELCLGGGSERRRTNSKRASARRESNSNHGVSNVSGTRTTPTDGILGAVITDDCEVVP